MASFTSVRYGSRFKPLAPNTAYRMLNPRQRAGYVNSPGQGPFSLASLVGNQNPAAALNGTPTTTPAVTPAQNATPSAGAQAQVQQAPAFSPPTADSLATDPILMQIRDLGQRSIADARSGALAGAERAIIGYGSVDVPQTLKDLYAKDSSNPIYAAFNDANTQQAASANPDSTLKQLATEHERNNAALDQATNAQNLYYSSTHANLLGDEQTGYRQRQSQAAQSLADLLSQAYQGVLDAQQRASDQYQAELPNAYGRALDLASLLGGDTTAGDTSGPSAGNSGANFNPGPGLPQTAEDYWAALMQAARNPSRPVAYTGV